MMPTSLRFVINLLAQYLIHHKFYYYYLNMTEPEGEVTLFSIM